MELIIYNFSVENENQFYNNMTFYSKLYKKLYLNAKIEEK